MIERTISRWSPVVPGMTLAIAALVWGGAASAEAGQATGSSSTIVIHAGDQGDGDRVARIVADPSAILIWREQHASYEDAGVVGPEKAIAAARQRGLEPGRAPWRVFLLVDRGLDRPVWRVLNTTVAELGRTEGRAVTIDASSGEVISVTEWWSRVL